MPDCTAPANLDRYAVIGHPIQHSLSPLIHTTFAQQLAMPLAYTTLDAKPAEFAAVTERFFSAGGRGLNVTMPHKAAAFALCEHVTMRARVAGAVNTLWQSAAGELHGDITDGAGLVADLTTFLGIAVAGQRILILGAGGSVYGCLGDLLAQRPASVCVANRTASRALAAARNFAGLGPVQGCGLDAIPDTAFDLVINATAASLEGATPAIRPSVIDAAIAYDLMYQKGGTVFTQWSSTHGARSVHTGIGMLVEQAAFAFELWRGVRPPTEAVRQLLATQHGFAF